MILLRLSCALNKAVPRVLSHLWGHCCQPHGPRKDLGNLQVQGQGHRQMGVLCPPWQHCCGRPPRWPMGEAGFLCSLPLLTLLAGFLALSSVSDHRTATHQAIGVSAGRTLVHISLDVQHEHDRSHLLGFLTASAWTTAPPWLLHLNTQVKVVVAQSCLTLCSPMDWSPPGSSVHGTLQVRILEWVATPFSRGSSWPRTQTQVSCIAGKFSPVWATREASTTTSY